MKNYIGQGICIFLILIGIGGCSYLIDKGMAIRIQAEHQRDYRKGTDNEQNKPTDTK